MRISEDDLEDGGVTRLLEEHLAHMRRITPSGSVHAAGPDDWGAIRYWSARMDGEVVGCAGLRQIDSSSGEIKSMRTSEAWRRRGIAGALLEELIRVARGSGYSSLYLETGSTTAFAAARAFYERYGFEPCGPFDGYQAHPHSAFMILHL